MTKKKPPEGFFFRNVEFEALDGCASLQSRDFQAAISINDDARRSDYQGKEKCVFAHFEQRIQPGCGNLDAESRITGVRSEFTHLRSSRSGIGMCDFCGTAQVILECAALEIWRTCNVAVREFLKFSHAPRLASSRKGSETVAEELSARSRQEIAALAIKAHRSQCAVNVPYRHNWPSTFSHFCNPGDTFRASVFCG